MCVNKKQKEVHNVQYHNKHRYTEGYATDYVMYTHSIPIIHKHLPKNIRSSGRILIKHFGHAKNHKQNPSQNCNKKPNYMSLPSTIYGSYLFTRFFQKGYTIN